MLRESLETNDGPVIIKYRIHKGGFAVELAREKLRYLSFTMISTKIKGK